MVDWLAARISLMYHLVESSSPVGVLGRSKEHIAQRWALCYRGPYRTHTKEFRWRVARQLVLPERAAGFSARRVSAWNRFCFFSPGLETWTVRVATPVEEPSMVLFERSLDRLSFPSKVTRKGKSRGLASGQVKGERSGSLVFFDQFGQSVRWCQSGWHAPEG
jgi:hypothetical protein